MLAITVALPVVRGPVLLAKAPASLDVLSGGRGRRPRPGTDTPLERFHVAWLVGAFFCAAAVGATTLIPHSPFPSGRAVPTITPEETPCGPQQHLSMH